MPGDVIDLRGAHAGIHQRQPETRGNCQGKPAVLQVQYPPHHFGERERDMTERAKRAAQELVRRGWQIDESDDSALDKECTQCGYTMRSDSRFCQQCGTRVAYQPADTSLDDIEAAIVAALKECEGRAGMRGTGAWTALTAAADAIRSIKP